MLPALLLLASLGACGGEDHGPMAIERLAPGLAPDALAVPDEQLVARWDVLTEPDLWRFEAPEANPARRDDALGGEGGRVLRLSADVSEQMVRVIREQPVDTRLVNEVRLDVVFRGHGGVRLEFWRFGEVEWRTENVVVAADGELRRVTLGIPFRMRDRDPFEAMSVRFDGDARSVDVRTIELVSRHPASLVPDPGGDPELVLVGDEARRAVGVATDRPLLMEARVPVGGRLAFATAQPHEVRRRLVGASLRVTVTDETGRSDVHRVEFERDGDEASRWHWSNIPLDRVVGRHVNVHFAMETADGKPGACVLAEAAILSPAEPRPTVLLITTDTHRGDHLGLTDPDGELKTPVLDALAGRGVLYEDCFAPITTTNPSHAALMTGEHPRDVGVLNNATGLMPSAPTIVQRFRDAGYATWAALSTSHIGPKISGLGTGYDRVSWPPHVPRDSGDTISVLEDWMDERDGRPLFVWLHVFDPHSPYEPPEAYDRAYYPGDRDPFDPSQPAFDAGPATFPKDLQGLRDPDFPLAQYKAEVTAQDAELARVLEDERFADAIVAVVGDHGEAFGEHGIWFNHDGLYPQTMRVPLIVAWPGAPAGTRVASPVMHTDVGRTLLDLAGLEQAAFPGRSLVGRKGEGAPRFGLALNATTASVTHQGLHLVLQLRAHRMHAMEHAVEKHEVELFDLRSDPDCLTDLVDERPDDVRRLRARLIEWLGSARDLGWAGEETKDPTTIAKLAALGYASDSSASPASLWVEDDCDWCRRVR
ncbi:MAG: sulfatase family protein [Planctomycetota bacterium]